MNARLTASSTGEPNAPLRVILAGLGVRGKYWAEVITESSDAVIAAYVDPNPAARQRAIETFGDRPAFETVEDAIRGTPEAGALVLANPPIGREAQVRAACAARLPMLIEKPLALSVTEAAQLVAIAEDAGIPLMVGLNFRYLPVTIETRRLLASGQIGVPAFGRFTYERYRDGNRPDLNKYPLTMDQPMLWEQSIHHFDLLRYVYGSEPVAVQARTWNPPWSMYESDANVAALFTFENGMVVNYQGTWQSAWSEPQFEWRTDCTGGIIRQFDQFGALNFGTRFQKDLTPVPLPQHRIWVSETKGLFEAFCDAVLRGQPLQCSGRDHLQSLAMVEACAISSRAGSTIAIRDVLQGTALAGTAGAGQP